MTARKAVSLGEAVAAFLATLTPSTRRHYATALDALTAEFGAGTEVSALDPDAVASWLTGRWGGMSAATWNLRVAAVRGASAWWRDEREWDMPDVAKRLKNRSEHAVLPPDVLDEDELHAMLKQCSLRAPTGIRNRALLTVMYRAGLRIGEALALRVTDVDMRRGTISVLAGKGGHQRTVAIDDGALGVVLRWLDKRKELGIRANGHPLFCTLDGGGLDESYVRRTIKRIASKAGVEKRAHPHGLRRSHAAELVAEGVPMPVIQKQFGHAKLSTTDVYTRQVAPGDVIAMGRARKPFSDTPYAPESRCTKCGYLRSKVVPECDHGDEPDLAGEVRDLRERLAALEDRKDTGN